MSWKTCGPASLKARDVMECRCAEHHAEQVEGAAKPARQEKVKMGFQLYRPPTLLASTPAEVVPKGFHHALEGMADYLHHCVSGGVATRASLMSIQIEQRH